jgi:hypothetical protein
MQKTPIKETLSTLILETKLSKIEYRNVWTVRVVALVIVFLTLNVNDSFLSENLPGKNRKWATQWIAENGMNSPSIVESESLKPLFASLNTIEIPKNGNPNLTNTNVEVINVISNDGGIKNANKKFGPEISSNTAILMNNAGSSEGFMLASSRTGLTISEPSKVPEVVELNTSVNYEQQLEYNYWLAAQNNVLENQKKVNKTQWMARGTIGPQYAQGVVSQPSASTYANKSNINNIITDTEGMSANNSNNAFSAMLNFGMSIGSNMQLLSGLNFSQMDGAHSAYYDSEVLKTQNIITTTINTAENGVKTTNLVEEDVVYTNYFSDTLRANYRVTSVEIPLVMKYNFGKNKLSYFLSSGVSANLGSSYTANYQSNEIGAGGIKETKYGVNSVNLLFGLGMEFKATSKITLQLSPGYKYGIPVSNSSVFNSPVSSLGLFTGLSYYFD